MADQIAESERLSAAGVVRAAARISSRSGPGRTEQDCSEVQAAGLPWRHRPLGCVAMLLAQSTSHSSHTGPVQSGHGGPVSAGRRPLRWLAAAVPEASTDHERRRRRQASGGGVRRPSSSPRTRAASDSALPATARRPDGSANAHSVQPAPGPGHFAGCLTAQGEVFLLPADGHGHHAEDSRGYPGAEQTDGCERDLGGHGGSPLPGWMLAPAARFMAEALPGGCGRGDGLPAAWPFCAARSPGEACKLRGAAVAQRNRSRAWRLAQGGIWTLAARPAGPRRLQEQAVSLADPPGVVLAGVMRYWWMVMACSWQMAPVRGLAAAPGRQGRTALAAVAVALGSGARAAASAGSVHAADRALVRHYLSADRPGCRFPASPPAAPAANQEAFSVLRSCGTRRWSRQAHLQLDEPAGRVVHLAHGQAEPVPDKPEPLAAGPGDQLVGVLRLL